jgi:hypothetical protein
VGGTACENVLGQCRMRLVSGNMFTPRCVCVIAHKFFSKGKTVIQCQHSHEAAQPHSHTAERIRSSVNYSLPVL